jgi:hypothetical protein
MPYDSGAFLFTVQPVLCQPVGPAPELFESRSEIYLRGLYDWSFENQSALDQHLKEIL